MYSMYHGNIFGNTVVTFHCARRLKKYPGNSLNICKLTGFMIRDELMTHLNTFSVVSEKPHGLSTDISGTAFKPLVSTGQMDRSNR